MRVPQLSVRVPASTSNLGPGFDLLGLALDLHLEVECLGPAAGPESELQEFGGEARDWPREGDLLRTSLARGAQRLGLSLPPLALRVRSQIPLERGLGSSGAAIVAGLVLARELAARHVDERELLAWAFELEGHPDNVTPALLGGCTLSLPTPRGLKAIAQRVHPSIRVAVAWPAQRLGTRAARSVLPARVPFADAVENPRRLALLLEGLREGDPELLELGGEDRLHVPYRMPLIRGAERALAAARGAGAWLATLSGSGSGLVALGGAERIAAVAEAMRSAFAEQDAEAQACVVAIATRGAQVDRSDPASA